MKRFVVFALLMLAPQFASAAPLDAFIAGYAKEHNFNGTILVQKDGAIAYEKSFGLANIQLKAPDTNETRYKIASITKIFTAALVLQLQEQGRLDLDKTIGAYLPDYTGEGRDKVTIHELLDHTSGLDNIDKVKTAQDAIDNGLPVYQHPYTTDQLLTKFCSGKLAAVPGTKFDYNNADYIVLGKIIERITGKSFDAVLEQQILDPLKLTNTGMLYQRDVIDGLASTYFYRDDLKALVNDLPVYPENWYAAGATYSTVDDLRIYASALFGGKILKPETLALMVKTGLGDYGFGLWSYDTKAGEKSYRVVKRPGQVMGAQGQVYRFLDRDITVVILSNTGTTDLDEFVAKIGREVAD
jgi:D-alanyl-D-alanine carboxypeptidase